MWATAAESGTALPGWWQQGDFIRAYENNRRGANQLALDASVIGGPIPELLAKQPDKTWTGTAAQLLEKLNAARGDKKPEKGFPASARGLSGLLRRTAPNLRAAGTDVTFGRENHERIITLSATADSKGKQPFRPSPSSLGEENAQNSEGFLPVAENGRGNAGSGRADQRSPQPSPNVAQKTVETQGLFENGNGRNDWNGVSSTQRGAPEEVKI